MISKLKIIAVAYMHLNDVSESSSRRFEWYEAGMLE